MNNREEFNVFLESPQMQNLYAKSSLSYRTGETCKLIRTGADKSQFNLTPSFVPYTSECYRVYFNKHQTSIFEFKLSYHQNGRFVFSA